MPFKTSRLRTPSLSAMASSRGQRITQVQQSIRGEPCPRDMPVAYRLRRRGDVVRLVCRPIRPVQILPRQNEVLPERLPTCHRTTSKANEAYLALILLAAKRYTEI